MISGLLSNSHLLPQLLLFIAVLMVFYSSRTMFVMHGKTSRRLKAKPGSSVKSATVGTSMGLGLADNEKLKRFEKYLTPSDPDKLSALRLSLIRAGYRHPSAVRIFYAYRIALAASAVIFSVLVLPTAMRGLPVYMSILLMATILLIGFFGPKFWVERAYQYRKMAIEKGFPDALDLLLVCIEAGNGFDQALNRVVNELDTSSKILAEELLIVTRELRAGKDRYKVLGDFADKSGVDDVKSFITVIKQADKFGVSIAEALRVYSREMRDKRYMKAEEKANLMPVKLALGAIVFTVPPAIIVMVGPSIIMIVRHLGGIEV